jgi:hypothetical protein
MANELYTAPIPYGMTNAPSLPTSAPTLDQISSSLATAAAASAPPTITPAPTAPTAAVAYSPSLKAFYVNGRVFEADNETEAANSLSYLNESQRAPLPQSGDWQPLDTSSYLGHVQKIVDPTMWRQMSRNFGIAVDNTQMLGGALLHFAGAEETGRNVIAQQEKDLAKTEVYNRNFTDIGTKQYGVERGLFDWFISNLAQQGPNMIESAVTAALGALAGGAAGGGPNPFTAAGGAILALTEKQAFKQSVLAAAKKYSAGEALDAAESKLLREAAGITAAAVIKNPETRALSTQVLTGAARDEAQNLYERGVARDILQASAGKINQAGLNQARVGGAALATLGQNYATGVADIYGEMMDAGVEDRAVASALAIPYAALESLPEFLLAGRLFSDIGAKHGTLRDFPTKTAKAMELLKRGVKGGLVGGTSEGLTETGQEGLLLAANPFVDWDSPQGLNRLINSFAAGFGVGGPIGAIAHLKDTKQSANILNPTQSAEPNALTAPPSAPNDGDFTVMPPSGPAPTPGLPNGGGNALALPKPRGINMNEPYNVVYGEGNLPSTTGTQAVLPIFDQNNPISVDEMRMRMSPQQTVNPQEQAQTPAQPYVDPRQGALQFSGPAPYTQQQGPFNTQMATQLQQQQDSQRRAQEFEAAQAQRAQQEQAVRDQAWNPASIQSQIQLMEQQLADEKAAGNQPTSSNLPMVTPEPRAPKQLSLFRGKVKLPKMSKEQQRIAKKLLKTQQQVGTPVSQVGPGDLRKSKQIPLFTQEGKPSVAALKSAGTRQAVSAPTVQTGAVQIPPTGNAVTPASVAAAVSKLKKGAANATTQGQVQQNGGQERNNTGQRLQEVGSNRNVTPQEQGGGNQTGRGNQLKQGRAKQTQEAVVEVGKKKEPVKAAVLKKGTEPKKAQAAAAAAENKAAVEPAYTDHIEAWEDMKPEGAVTFDRLPSKTQQAWQQAVADNRASMSLATELFDNADIELTPYEALAGEIAAAEATSDINTFRAAVDTVIFHAFFDSDPNSKRDGLVEMANQWLANTGFSDKQRQAINDSVVSQANERQKLEAAYKSGAQKGEAKPWFNYVESQNLVGRIKDLNARVTMLPAKYKTTAEASMGEALGEKKSVGTSNDRFVNKPWAALENIIDSMLGGYELINRKSELAKLQARIANLYAQAKEAGKLNYITSRAIALKDFFTESGELKVYKNADGYFVPTNKTMSEEQVKKAQDEQRAARRALAEEDRKKFAEENAQRQREAGKPVSSEDVMSEWDSNKQDGMYYRDDGSPITSSIPIGRVRMLMNGFVSRFKIKPTTYVFKNIEDMKRVNPELYKQAAAARANGDFGSVNAVGYSFKGNVIIFSDYVRSEKQLGFVLAHEALGHFGFKAIMSAGELNTMLNSIYNSDARVRSMVEQMMMMKGMTKLEAVEEYLADFAADMDVSMIARAWNFIKNALNKIGFKFDDDMARMIIGQARKYMRDGNGSYISAAKLAENMRNMERMEKDGRYAADALDGHGMASTYSTTAAMNKIAGEYGGIHGAAKFFREGKIAQYMNSQKGGATAWIARSLEKVQTLDNMASRSDGLTRVFQIFQAQNNKARALLSHYNRLTAFTHTAGVTEKEKDTAGELLANAALFRGPEATEQMLRDAGKFVVTDEYGNITLNHNAIEAAKQRGFVTADEFRKGFEFTDSTGSKQKYQFNVDENANYWKVYKEQRAAVAEAAIDVMLANFEASQYEQQAAINRVSNLRGKDNSAFAAEDIAAIKQIAKVFQDMASERMDLDGAKLKINENSYERADRWLIEVTRSIYENLKLTDWLTTAADDEMVNRYKENSKYGKDLEAALAAAVTDKERATAQAKLNQYKRDVERTKGVIDTLKSLNAKGMTKEQTYKIQRAIRDLFLFQTQTQNAEYYAKRTILGSYVPFTRRGRLQVNLVAYDENGNIVQVDAATAGVMPYFQADDKAVADEIRSQLLDLFDGKTYTVMNNEDQEVKVRFVAESSVANASPDLSDVINFNDFVYVLNRLNINIEPKERQRIVEALTAQNETARRNLNRTGNPGYDRNVVRNVSEFLESAAHVSAKKIYRNRLDDVIQNKNYWLGSSEKLKQLERAVKYAKTDNERARAQREYEKYAYQYIHMKAEGHSINVNGQTHQTLGRGRLYHEEAKKLIRWHGERINISNSTEDLLTEYGSPLKMWTVLMQLGGSVASAAVNVVSLVTHSWSYLSYYNPDRGYGGGYGGGRSGATLFTALADVKNAKLADAQYLSELLQSGDYVKFGLTEDETKFLFDQTEKGTLQAAAFNALLGSSRGKVQNNKAAAVIQSYMSMFSYTEQLNRRVTALAAYRLEKTRSLAEGLNEEDAISSAARVGQDAVNTSQGEYAMYNRPEMARGNLMQYVFMYKQFAIISVQLLKGMNYQGRLQFLGLILLMSGMKGLPFADDLMDLFDTLCQMFGIKTPAVEKSLYEFFDSVAPGSAPFMMRGVIDQWTGATVSTRLGMGDLIPLSGVFKAGADPWRETENFVGPVFSGIAGIVGTGSMLASYGLEALGLKDDKTTLNDVFRKSPIALARALGDAYSYHDTGAITTPDGKMISRDAGTSTMVARALGFYPAIATQQNDIVRVAKASRDYMLDVKASYTAAYVKAAMANDNEAKAKIIDSVKKWNEGAKGTGLEVRNFQGAAMTAFREASRPTALRFQRSAPVGLRPEVVELMRLHGITADELNGIGQ